MVTNVTKNSSNGQVQFEKSILRSLFMEKFNDIFNNIQVLESNNIDSNFLYSQKRLILKTN